MAYTIEGLEPQRFQHLYGLSDADLRRAGVVRYTVDERPGFPCRVTLEDLAPGATALLLNYEHMPLDSPYRASHAIFVAEGASEPARFVDEVPPVIHRRTISLRAFDGFGMMVDAALATGADVETALVRLFDRADVEFVDMHNAARGCFAARAVRSGT